MKKPTNHLASQTERFASLKLPHQSYIVQLQQLTTIIKQAWQPLLPSQSLDSLSVINDEGQSLTISTHHHTLANHLTYSRQPLLNQLHQHEPALQRVLQLKFRVIAPLTASTSEKDLQGNHNVTNVTSCELSESTKRNIAQTIAVVTDDIRLQSVLQKFLKP